MTIEYTAGYTYNLQKQEEILRENKNMKKGYSFTYRTRYYSMYLLLQDHPRYSLHNFEELSGSQASFQQHEQQDQHTRGQEI